MAGSQSPPRRGLRRFDSHVASLLDLLNKRRGTCSPHVADQVGALRRRHAAALKWLIGGDVQLRFFGRDILDAFWKATDEVNAEISASNPTLRQLLDHWTAFRHGTATWFAIAETSLDA